MSSAESFLAEIGRACDELGYGLMRLELGRIEVRPIGEPDVLIDISTDRMFLSADTLRKVLAPRAKEAANR